MKGEPDAKPSEEFDFSVEFLIESSPNPYHGDYTEDIPDRIQNELGGVLFTKDYIPLGPVKAKEFQITQEMRRFMQYTVENVEHHMDLRVDEFFKLLKSKSQVS